MLGTGPVYLLTGLSYLRWAIEAITIGTLNSTPAYLRPVLLHASARQGFCGLHHIFRWDQGEWISDAQAQQLLHLLGSGGAMCQQFVQHDIIALLAQAALMYLVVLLALYGIRRSQRF
ncbi:hypothetical protein WJX72_000572 [[Myrmecia] bisecta]|uniref:Uncharacterized protein n=1 Tax=[Myrmecia] bisecta TaxID=41462 RepID=A0AAW1R4E6_9CHLO